MSIILLPKTSDNFFVLSAFLQQPLCPHNMTQSSLVLLKHIEKLMKFVAT